MGLLNWPPSRGPNPHEHANEYVPGAATREDIEPGRSPQSEAVEAEREAIESDLNDLNDAPEEEFSETVSEISALGAPFGEPTPKRPLVGRWHAWYQVDDVARLTLEQAVAFVRACKLEPEEAKHCDGDGHLDDWYGYEPRTLTVDITYPLSIGVRLVVPPMTRRIMPCHACEGDDAGSEDRAEMTAGYLLWMVAKEYERIYREHEKYGVWGHAIGDLGFEGIEVDEDGNATILMGS